jgi:hypothetical protein
MARSRQEIAIVLLVRQNRPAVYGVVYVGDLSQSIQHNWAMRVQAHDASAVTAAIAQPAKAFEEDPVEALRAMHTLPRIRG